MLRIKDEGHFRQVVGSAREAGESHLLFECMWALHMLGDEPRRDSADAMLLGAAAMFASHVFYVRTQDPKSRRPGSTSLVNLLLPHYHALSEYFVDRESAWYTSRRPSAVVELGPPPQWPGAAARFGWSEAASARFGWSQLRLEEDGKEQVVGTGVVTYREDPGSRSNPWRVRRLPSGDLVTDGYRVAGIGYGG